MKDLGFIRVGAASPRMKVADPDYNTDQILKLLDKSLKNGIKIVVFP